LDRVKRQLQRGDRRQARRGPSERRREPCPRGRTGAAAPAANAPKGRGAPDNYQPLIATLAALERCKLKEDGSETEGPQTRLRQPDARGAQLQAASRLSELERLATAVKANPKLGAPLHETATSALEDWND
jgi:hypothetical protein